MSIFSNLFKRHAKTRLEIDDEVFGRMHFVEGAKDGPHCWQSMIKFASENERIILTIDTPSVETPPSDEQHAFFNRVSGNYVNLRLEANNAISKELALLGNDSEFSEPNRFGLIGLDIPIDCAHEPIWRLSFAPFPDAEDDDWVIDVEMKGDRAQEVFLTH